MSSRRARAIALLLAASAVGCGKKGPPLPPEPRGPLAAAAPELRQAGATAVVTFRVPQPRGDDPAQRPVAAELLRVEYAPGPVPEPDPDLFARRGRVAARVPDLVSDGRIEMLDPALPSPGSILRYAVRILDRRGRPSPLALLPDLEVAPPPSPPGDLAGEATADGIRLHWTAPAGEGPFLFRVWRAEEGAVLSPAHAEPLEETSFLDGSVVTGAAYVYEVRTALAGDPPYRESVPAGSLRIEAIDRFAPAPPAGPAAVQEGAAVRVLWQAGTERDLAGWRLFRREEGGEWSVHPPELLTRPLYLDAEVRPGRTYRYRVVALDRTEPPNVSAPSEEVEVLVADDPSAGSGP